MAHILPEINLNLFGMLDMSFEIWVQSLKFFSSVTLLKSTHLFPKHHIVPDMQKYQRHLPWLTLYLGACYCSFPRHIGL